jgi:hypothetical protein
MPNISCNYRTKWSNYHRTYEVEVREIANVFAADIADLTGPVRFALTAEMFYKFICETLKADTGLFKQPAAEAAVMVGTGWSFSKLSLAKDMLLDLSGLSGITMARPEHMHQDTNLDPSYIALTSGGTRLRELVEWAQKLSNQGQQGAEDRSIPTSGSFLGTTIAGSFATASHGSRLGFGGIQDMIVGMHIITGQATSVWLERESKPTLNDETALSFATDIERDDAKFEDALIHLGGMGIVNGVAIELIDNKGYRRLAVNYPIDSAWLQKIENGEFQDLASQLGHEADPVFYELTIDPRGYEGPIALHTMLFEGGMPMRNELKLNIKGAADTITTFGTFPETVLQAFQPLLTGGELALAGAEEVPELTPEFSVLKLYAIDEKQGGFFKYQLPPINAADPSYSWLAYHDREITGGVPGALYNASFAIDRRNLERAITAMCAIMKSAELPQTFLFTVRFVSNSSGTLRFTRFDECAVIEIDGISSNAPDIEGLGDSATLGQVIVKGASLVRQALEDAGVDYSMHWGKLGGLDKLKVQRDFGPANDPKSPIGRWRATRDALLSPEAKSLFWSEELYRLGLLELAPVSE